MKRENETLKTIKKCIRRGEVFTFNYTHVDKTVREYTMLPYDIDQKYTLFGFDQVAGRERAFKMGYIEVISIEKVDGYIEDQYSENKSSLIKKGTSIMYNYDNGFIRTF